MESVRELRVAAGLTQDEVCKRAGIARPNLSAYENGRRTPSQETVDLIRRACRSRPSTALAQNREQVLAIVRAHRGAGVEVFGSVARGDDRWDSDLDLLVTMGEGAGYLDLARMKAALEAALNVPVDVVLKNGIDSVHPSAADAQILRDARSIEEAHAS